MTRKPLSKSIRFEVFKRDKFSCQYCGQAAPQVVLHVDHINPVADGGDNDILNLVTSCASCNHGKSDRRLDDQSAVTKAQKQAEQLQARREQMLMMAEWHRELKSLDDQMVDIVRDHWAHLLNDDKFQFSSYGAQQMRKHIAKYGFDRVLGASTKSASQYLQFNKSGIATSDSQENAINKVPAILHWEDKFKENPKLERLFRLKHIIAKRYGYSNDSMCIQLLRKASDMGVELSDLESMIFESSCWTDWRNSMEELIDSMTLDQE